MLMFFPKFTLDYFNLENSYKDQLKPEELPSDSLREKRDEEAISFGLKDKYQITAVRNYLNRTKRGFNLKQVCLRCVLHMCKYNVGTWSAHKCGN